MVIKSVVDETTLTRSVCTLPTTTAAVNHKNAPTLPLSLPAQNLRLKIGPVTLPPAGPAIAAADEMQQQQPREAETLLIRCWAHLRPTTPQTQRRNLQPRRKHTLSHTHTYTHTPIHIPTHTHTQDVRRRMNTETYTSAMCKEMHKLRQRQMNLCINASTHAERHKHTLIETSTKHIKPDVHR